MRQLFTRSTILNFKRSIAPRLHSSIAFEPVDEAKPFNKKILLLGAPGVGKGSYASRTCEQLNIPHFAAGDVIRDEIKSNTPLGIQLQKYTSEGKLVPDEIIVEMLMAHISKLGKNKGYILDGFPRTIHQAQVLDEYVDLNLVINLTQREDIIIKKITSRRVCSNCGANYNLAHIKEDGIDMPPLLPKVDGICDNCGAKDSLFQREDDVEHVVRDRLATYQELTSPLIQFYSEKHILKDFKVNGGVHQLLPDFIELIKNPHPTKF